MRVTGTLQQQAWLRRELPPVEQVTPGVWSVPVPIPDNPLRYVLSYVIEHAAGFVLVDPGWDDPASWQALTDGLAACGVPLDAITAVLITHVHPDHHGLSGAVQEKSGAWIGMHEREDGFLTAVARPIRRSGPAGTCAGAVPPKSTSGSSRPTPRPRAAAPRWPARTVSWPTAI